MEKDQLYKIYHTKLWEKCRKNVLLRYFGYDIWELAEGRVIKPDMVVIHHIIERREDPELIYSLDNLITVSPESHRTIHTYYATNKAYALERIQRGIKKFNELFPNP